MQSFDERTQRNRLPEDIPSRSKDLAALLLAARTSEAGFTPSLSSVPSGMPRSRARVLMTTAPEKAPESVDTQQLMDTMLENAPVSDRKLSEAEKENMREYFRQSIREAAEQVRKKEKSGGNVILDRDKKPDLESQSQKLSKRKEMLAIAKRMAENEASKIREQQAEVESDLVSFDDELAKMRELVKKSAATTSEEAMPKPESSLKLKDKVIEYILLVMALEGFANVIQQAYKLWLSSGTGDFIDLLGSAIFGAVTWVLFKKRESANIEARKEDDATMTKWRRERKSEDGYRF